MSAPDRLNWMPPGHRPARKRGYVHPCDAPHPGTERVRKPKAPPSRPGTDAQAPPEAGTNGEATPEAGTEPPMMLIGSVHADLSPDIQVRVWADGIQGWPCDTCGQPKCFYYYKQRMLCRLCAVRLQTVLKRLRHAAGSGQAP